MNKIQINFLRPENNFKPELPREEKPKFNKRLIIYFLALFLVVFMGGCIAKKITLATWPSDASSYDPLTLKPKKTGFFNTIKNFIFSPENVLQGESADRVNILLLGIGGAGHDGPYLSDTSIIVSVKPKSGEVAMISIPRDTAVKLEGEKTYRKINYIDAYGEMKNPGQGGEFARQFFAKNFDIDIPYYVRVDFNAFKELVDIVGGVNINVKNSFVDYEYPGPNYSYQTITFKAGEQWMDGETALKYARSRHGSGGEGSDFARSRRQQQVIAALKEKLLSSSTYTNPIKIKQIYDSVAKNLQTNLNFGQIMYLASMAKSIDMNKIKNLVFDDSPNGYLTQATIYGNWLLMPKSGNFEEINEAIKNVFNANYQFKSTTVFSIQTSIMPSAKIEIQNGTWQVGLAGRVQKRLEENGFKVDAVGNTVERPISTTTIYLVNSNADETIVEALKRNLNIPIAKNIPNWLEYSYDNQKTPTNESGDKYASSTEILIILGNDYSATSSTSTINNNGITISSSTENLNEETYP